MNRQRSTSVGILAAIGLLVLGCATWVVVDSVGTADDADAERIVRSYLDALTADDYPTAYALICTDETGIERDEFERAARREPVRSYEIGASVAWSSPVDGSGREYRVTVTGATGVRAAQRIRTQGGRCIQYGNISTG
ncbi:hypothetical protein [Catellatospora citrea]|uniref:DUF4878 domain-containing protein n=1 Tax=Catellatospora citrea TaxID=53366 RepID=A0A8J3KGS7_9ACTN|nr:hypothetical protein [Catellatospora citrea]RKE02658.1 hypothetical protein C8E86_7966 [Catellatospora citrea]GIF99487.1 hypothetical protein Cci01nite_45810 [Catellatospora citrea]